MAEHINESIVGKSSNLRIAVLSIIYFFFIYNFQIPGLPNGVLYYRVALIMLFAYTWMKKAAYFGGSKTSKMVKKYLFWNVFLFIYVGLILLSFGRGDGVSALPSYVNMLIVLPLFYISGKFIFRDVDELMKVLYIGCIIQATIIILATLSPSLEMVLKSFYLGDVSDTENVDIIERMTSGGYQIGFQCFTSQGSLKMAMGQVGACYFLMKKDGSRFILHLFLFLLITFATSLLSRTGLFLSAACLFVVLINKGKKGYKGLSTSLLIILIVFFIFSYISGNFVSNEYLSDNFRRFASLFSTGMEESYFIEWKGQGVGYNVVPSISINTLIGLGIKQGTSGSGIQTIVDGGFLINYSSMGLIVAIINYLIIFSFFKKQYDFSKNHIYKSLILCLFIILIMGEIKEHFIYQLYFMSFLFVIFYLMEKETVFYTEHKTQK
jgi:hypothetical protein